MNITLNGQERIVKEGLSIKSLMEEFQLDSRKLAIEQNRVIIPAHLYSSTYVMEGDAIEVVQFIGGG